MTKENGMSFDDFDGQKVVLISDEAHHLNVDTRRKMTAEEEDSYHSWEETVKEIFHRNSGNVLLEFTATCDLENPAIRAAYEDKIIFNYPLDKFYKDRYSKDIITLRSDLGLMERALQAVVLSQYRMKLFQDHRLAIKPVVLFKAAKIADSKEFMAAFCGKMEKLTGGQLLELAEAADSPVMRRAFGYFERNGISPDTLAAELRDDFSRQHCVCVNDDKDAAQKQILLNSLEDADNPYRAIFEVRKLDEGWDVLNLSTLCGCMKRGSPAVRSCPRPPLRKRSSSDAAPDTARFGSMKSSRNSGANTTGTFPVKCGSVKSCIIIARTTIVM